MFSLSFLRCVIKLRLINARCFLLKKYLSMESGYLIKGDESRNDEIKFKYLINSQELNIHKFKLLRLRLESF